jgi:hypothetical protein
VDGWDTILTGPTFIPSSGGFSLGAFEQAPKTTATNVMDPMMNNHFLFTNIPPFCWPVPLNFFQSTGEDGRH